MLILKPVPHMDFQLSMTVYIITSSGTQIVAERNRTNIHPDLNGQDLLLAIISLFPIPLPKQRQENNDSER